jgi:TatD DNase family protein
MLIDTHCHLDQLQNPATVLRQAAEKNVARIVAVSENPTSMSAVLDLKKTCGDQVLAALGLHPAWLVQQSRAHILAALEFLRTHLALADELGEVGLDHKWAQTPEQQALQEEILQRQFALAAANGKPVNLHSRRCQRQVMEKAIEFHQQTGLNAQLHWFTQSKKLVRICNQEGIYISVGPTVINDLQAQGVALEIADELLLLESDAPVPVDGQPGHPGRVLAVADKLAQLKACSWQEIATLTSANCARYLSPP